MRRRSIAHLRASTRFQALALGASLFALTLGGAALAEPIRPAPVPAPAPASAPIPAPLILIPGQTVSGAKLADTVIVNQTATSGDFCTVTKTENTQTTTTGTATASTSVSVIVTCDVTIIVNP